MLRFALLSLIVLVSCSSTTLLRKSIVRRQNNQGPCQGIEGFQCQCSDTRITCSTDRDLPRPLKVPTNERQKYSSVELVISGAQDHTINDHTFEPVKQLFMPTASTVELRVKFEHFTGLHLTSPGLFNRVFPDNLPATTHKHLSLSIINPQVQPDDNVNLFANLNADLLELYVQYPFRGTFQQLFSGANIKHLRLTGGDIRSDLSQPFSGNIARLELAKHAEQLTTQIFPVYPAHELIIDAFYVSKFNSDNPPNYSNLGDLRIYSRERIPANAFRQYPNLHTLTVTADGDIDPHAFDGLQNLEKLTIRNARLPLDILNRLPNLKELETSIEKLDTEEQCRLVEKVANGQLAVQAIPSGQECTCESDYLGVAHGGYQCGAQNCDRSSCAAIRDSYDASERTFRAPPTIRRLDGSDTSRQREPKVYTGAYQVSREDQNKAQQGAVQAGNEQGGDAWQNDQRQDGQMDPHASTPPPSYHQQPDHDDQDTNQGAGGEGGQDADGNENQSGGYGGQNPQDGGGTGNQQGGDGSHAHDHTGDSNQSTDANLVDNADVPPSTKRKLGWLPIIIIIAVVAGLLLIGLIILLLRRRRTAAGYNPTATSEHGTTAARA